MRDFLEFAMVTWAAASLLAGTGALLFWGLGRWMRVPRRWRLISNAYAEGYRTGVAKRREIETPKDTTHD